MGTRQTVLETEILILLIHPILLLDYCARSFVADGPKMRNRNNIPLSHRQVFQHEYYDRVICPFDISTALAELEIAMDFAVYFGFGIARIGSVLMNVTCFEAGSISCQSLSPPIMS
jgi:hypothetical protein